MSAPFTELGSGLAVAVPGSVFLASLLGSPHCAMMCGPLVLAGVRGRGAHALYHLGRGAAYVLLGGVAGAIGAHALSSELQGEAISLVRWIAAAALASMLLWIGLRSWNGLSLHLPLPRWLESRTASAWGRLLQAKGSRIAALAMGLLTPLLPCGWLYGFVLAAAASGSAWRGAAILGSFWLGTIPALAGGSALVRQLLAPLARRAPRLSGGLLIFAAVAVIGLKMAGTPAHHPPTDCPMHEVHHP